jgi:hypothetical protein
MSNVEVAERSLIRITPRLIVGVGVLMLGLLWTLDNMDVLESEQITQFWPVILIAAGAVKMLDVAGRLFGGALVIAGTFLLLGSLGTIDFDLGDLIPLGIALIGAKLIWDALSRRPQASTAAVDPASSLSAVAVMAGVKRQSLSESFRGADATAIMGGVELDLRNAKIGEGAEAVIDTFAFWGGVEVVVPHDWKVVSHVMPLMGGFEDKTQQQVAPGGPVLIVRGMAIMGAVEVKN